MGIRVRLEAAIQRFAGESDRAVRGALIVAGQNRPQVQLGAVAHGYRNRRDERGKALARNSHQFVHPARQFEQSGECVLTADPAGQRLGRDHRRGPRCVAQQGDLADDQTGRHLADGGHAIGSGVGDLRPSGFDGQEGHGPFTLAHQHLSRRRRQRLHLRRQRHQRVDGAAVEEFQRREFVSADGGQSGHVTRLRRGLHGGQASEGNRRIGQPIWWS